MEKLKLNLEYYVGKSDKRSCSIYGYAMNTIFIHGDTWGDVEAKVQEFLANVKLEREELKKLEEGMPKSRVEEFD